MINVFAQSPPQSMDGAINRAPIIPMPGARTLALAIGKPDDAEEFAVAATVNEPELELGWWSLLRARAAARNFAGALEALTYLEDNFDHRLDEAKLRRDKYRAFASLASSQEFKDWRAGRK